MSDVSVPAVIKGRAELKERHDQDPTVDEIAAYLRYDVKDVLEVLRGLKRNRILDDRRRKGRREWRRWGDP